MISVNIGEEAVEAAALETEEAEKAPQATFNINVRKTLDNNIVMGDHPDIDIVITPSKNKIVLFPTDRSSDRTYEAQDKFFKYLQKKGLIDPSSVQGGNVFGSLEAIYPDSTEGNVSSLQIIIFVISKYLQEEKQYFDAADHFEEELEKSLTDPDKDESTELGEVPHSSQKGAIRPGYIYSPYGISSIYRY